ncbi:MAG: hypothetical protein P4M15_07210 [Alphaproteobacteria bacterium]|nr:hypothetical protein [Alphaproteobacteria bacterium]
MEISRRVRVIGRTHLVETAGDVIEFTVEVGKPSLGDKGVRVEHGASIRVGHLPRWR